MLQKLVMSKLPFLGDFKQKVLVKNRSFRYLGALHPPLFLRLPECVSPHNYIIWTPSLSLISKQIATAMHCTELKYAALDCSALFCTALYCTALHCIPLNNSALHCTALHRTALLCSAVKWNALHCREMLNYKKKYYIVNPTRRYGLLCGPTSSSCGGLRPSAKNLFLPFGHKKSLLCCFGHS